MVQWPPVAMSFPGRGLDYSAQITPPGFLQPGGVGGATAIAVSNTMAFALLNNGSVATWGTQVDGMADMYPVASASGTAELMVEVVPHFCSGR
jgi:hypothetical protein